MDIAADMCSVILTKAKTHPRGFDTVSKLTTTVIRKTSRLGST
jgi:hypothetical protein